MAEKKNWDPRADQIRMWRSMGLSFSSIALTIDMSRERVAQIREKYKGITPTPEERMAQCQTREAQVTAANLMILSMRLKNLQVPKFLREWERPKLSGPGPARAVYEAMRDDQATPDQVDFYVTRFLCPGLLDLRLKHSEWYHGKSAIVTEPEPTPVELNEDGKPDSESVSA